MKKVVVFGATGFTGRLVVSALLEMGVEDVVLGGRDAAKLAALAKEKRGVETRVADASRPATLGPLCEGAHVVVDTAGPFALYGEPVVRAAIDAGAHYLDTTGEQAFIAKIRDGYDDAAKAKRLAVVNAQAFEFALGCAAAALLAASDESIDTIDVFNRVAGNGVTRGTIKSAVGAMGEPALILRDGAVVARPFDLRPADVTMPGGKGPELAVPFPGSEALFLRASYPWLRNVTTNLVLPKPTAALAMAGVSAQPILKRMAEAGLFEPVLRRIDRGAEGPSDEKRRSQHFKVLARGRGKGAEKNVLVTGVDPYGITGIIAAIGAKMLLERAPDHVGVVSPDRAFGAKRLLDALEPYGVRVVWS